MKPQKTVHMMVGNIGTGKTVTTRRLVTAHENTLVVDIDPIVMMLGCGNYNPEMFTDRHRNLYGNLLRTMTAKVLEYGFDAIIDTTAMSKAKRKDFINIARVHNAIVKVYLHTTPGGLARRCEENRGQANEVWERVYKMFDEEYEEPSLAEGIEIIDCSWDPNNKGEVDVRST